MIQGVLIGNTPLIKIALSWKNSVVFSNVIVDTGFTGDIQITTEIALALKLTPTGFTQVRIANGDLITVKTAVAMVILEGVKKYVEILFSPSEPLLGVGLLKKFGYRAIVDGKNNTVFLEK